jgi:hypothetical protein
MNPEAYVGIAFGMLGALLGIIWKQLNNRLDRKDVEDAELAKQISTQLTDRIQRVETSLSTRLNERMLEHSSRLSNGSMRMDVLQKEISDHKVKLAEEYHSAADVRILVIDLMEPIKNQLNTMQAGLQLILTNQRNHQQ